MKPINKSVYFRKKMIHYIPGTNNNVYMICLMDICHVLGQQELFKTGQAQQLCPSGKKYPVHVNGKLFWFISVPELILFIDHLRQTHGPGKIYDELERWARGLTTDDTAKFESKTRKYTKQEPYNPEVMTSPVAQAELHQSSSKLYFKDQPIFFRSENGKYYMNATQMAHNFDRNPREWLLLVSTKKYRQALVDRGISDNMESQVIIKRGHLGETWLEMNVAIEMARWLSPELSAWFNEKIIELGLNGVVVMDRTNTGPPPGNDNLPQKYAVPASYREALLLAAAQQEEIERLSATNNKNKHKIDFYNDFIENRDWFKTTTIADELQITVIQLYSYLKDLKIISWDKQQYIANKGYSNLQCPAPYYWTNKLGKTRKNGDRIRWTKYGRDYIINLWKKNFPGQKRLN